MKIASPLKIQRFVNGVIKLHGEQKKKVQKKEAKEKPIARGKPAVSRIIISENESVMADRLLDRHSEVGLTERLFVDAIEMITVNHKQCAMEIEKRMQQFMEEVMKRKEELLSQCNDVKNEKIRVLSEQLDEITKYKGQLKAQSDKTERLFANEQMDRGARRKQVLTEGNAVLEKGVLTTPQVSVYLQLDWITPNEVTHVKSFSLPSHLFSSPLPLFFLSLCKNSVTF